MGRAFSAATIASLVEAYFGKDDKKFRAYAEHIAGAYEDDGNPRGAKLIRDRLAGIKPKGFAVLDHSSV